MKKKILLIGILVFILVFFLSCGDVGGTVIIENDTEWNNYVIIGKEEKKLIFPGEKRTKIFFAKDVPNVTVSVSWAYLISWRQKNFSLSGGETVELKISEFF